MSMETIGFIGLGIMGAPMAGHLVAAEHEVTGHNRSAAKAQIWAEKTGGMAAGTVAQAAASCWK